MLLSSPTDSKEQNILLSTTLKKDWKPVSFSNAKPNWQLVNGTLSQTKSCGSKKSGSGTALLYNKYEGRLYHISSQIGLGSTYQSGLVFNFKSSKDYFLFYVNRYSKAYQGYWIVVAHVKNGDFTNLCRERYNGNPPKIIDLTISDVGTAVDFYFNRKQIFTKEKVQLSGLVGLYSQQNNDVQFQSLEVRDYDIRVTMPSGNENNSQSNSSNEQRHSLVTENGLKDRTNGTNSLMDSNRTNELLSYTKLQPPRSKTLVDFTEIYTVPLDSFYERLYKNEEFNQPNMAGLLSEVESKVFKLDFRPRRWYRDYKKVKEAENFLEVDVTVLKEKINEIETGLNDVTDQDDFENKQTQLSKTRDKYLIQLNKLNEVREQKVILLREIRTNGFTIIEDQTPETILEKGYDFHIIGGQESVKSFTPVPVPYQMDYKDDAEWSKLDTKLRKKLLDSSVLTNNQKIKFKEQINQLKNFDSNHKIKNKIDEINLEITGHRTELDLLATKDSLKAERIQWVEDKETLQSELNNHPVEYYSNDFPLRVDGPHQMFAGGLVQGVKDSEKFRRWISQNAIIVNDSHPAMENYTLDYNTGNLSYIKSMNKLRIHLNGNYSNPTGGFVGLNYPDAGVYYHRLFGYISGNKWTVEPQSGRVNTQGQGPFTTFTYQWGGDRSIGNFFVESIKVCNYYINSLNQQIKSITNERIKLENEIISKEKAISALETLGLETERKNFLAYWNNPEALNVKTVTTNIISPDVDPLADLLINLSGNESGSVDYKTYFFDFLGDAFYNQEGQSLKEFTESLAYDPREVLAVVPHFDKSGKISKEVANAIANPKPSDLSKPELPIIKFAETYQIEIKWSGYGLGELSHTFNLFPGETKELVIEKATKSTTKRSASTTTSSVSTSKASKSFEENMKNEFSDQQKTSLEETEKSTDISKNTNTISDVDSKQNGFNINLAKPSVTSLFGETQSGGPSLGLNKTNKSTKSKSNVLEKSHTAETQKANNQSSEILKKNVKNTIEKVASETSSENKLEVSTSSSFDYEESETNKEVIKIENPNVGRTINYNFFQVQNIYEITTKLIDVKIIINPGIEIMKGSGMSDIRVFELEEFSKIFPNLDQDDHHSTLLAAIVARQIFKRYAKFKNGIGTGNGAVRVKEGHVIDENILNDLNFSSELNEKQFLHDLLNKLKSALKQFQKVPFEFNPVILDEKSYKTVNIGAYYLESELGERASTEQYLEDRREIETKMQRAGLDHLKKQTKSGVFYPPIPDSVTHINYEALQTLQNGKVEDEQSS